MLKKRKNRKEQLSVKAIIILFLVSISFISMGYSYLEEQLSIEGKGNLVKQSPVFSDDFGAEYEMTQWYSNGMFFYNYNLTITNNTYQTANGWRIEIVFPEETDNVVSWNTNIEEVSSTVYAFSNKGYNATIGPNAKFTFGIQFSTPTTAEWLPTYVIINGKTVMISNLPEEVELVIPINQTYPTNPTDPTDPDTTPVETPHVDAKFKANGAWGSPQQGYTGQYGLTITNNTKKRVTSWKVIIKKPEGVSMLNARNMNYVEQDDVIIISNVESNGSIDVGKSTKLGFQMSVPTQNYTPEIISIESK